MSYTVWLDGRERISQDHMRGYKLSFSFEGYSGADIVLTPHDAILSQDNFQDHLDSGAIMIQVKHSFDFSSSVLDGRLFESFTRMSSYDTHPYQRGLLITGGFQRVGNDLYIDGRRSNISWSSYIGSWDDWVLRGGVVYPVIAREDMQTSIDRLANRVFISDPFIQRPVSRKRKKFKPVKRFTKGMGLSQKARLAREGIDEHDLRHILVNFDGLSHQTVQGIWELLKEKNLERNMGNVVELAIMGMLSEVKGIGAVTEKKILKQLGY